MRKPIPQSLRKTVIKQQGISCHYCSRKTTPRNRHLDHKIPVEQGGQNTQDNLLVSCKQCNTRKSKKPYFDYITHRITQIELELQTLRKRLTDNAK
jgi:5-methylcytosine-specific restriction endonuclease McrA